MKNGGGVWIWKEENVRQLCSESDAKNRKCF